LDLCILLLTVAAPALLASTSNRGSFLPKKVVHNAVVLPCEEEPEIFSTEYLGLPAYKYSDADPNCQDMGFSFGYKMEGCFPGDDIEFENLVQTKGECSEGVLNVGSFDLICVPNDEGELIDAIIVPDADIVVIMKGANGGVIYGDLKAGQQYMLDVGTRKAISHIEFCFMCDGCEKAPEASPVFTPVATPVTTPVASPAATPVITPVVTPVATPVTSPVETPVATPMATPASFPVATPVAAPVEMPVATPVATPVSAPVATPMGTPVATPAATPDATPVSAPVATPMGTPVATPVTTPVATPVTTPVATPVVSPVSTPVTTPVDIPVATPVTAPVATPVTTPVATPVATPMATPVTTPVATPVDTPVAAPVTTVAPPVATPIASPVPNPFATPVVTPVEKPVASPIESPIQTMAPTTKGSGSGDPHFMVNFPRRSPVLFCAPNSPHPPLTQTWNGEKYDYHGECDLVLVDNPTFNGGQGLKLHIRTTHVRYFSFIEKIALQIGKDILEFHNDAENFLINGTKVEPKQKHHKTMFAGFVVRRDKNAISVRLHDEGRHSHNVAKIDFHRRKNGFPAVIVDGGDTDIFSGSLGLLGEWKTGRRMARDRFTELNDQDATAFALEWQVRDNEPIVFQEVRAPQFPMACKPPEKMLKNRLGATHILQAAEKACAHWKEDKEDCIFDVVATRDVSIAAEGHIIHLQ
jgi:hypothetical protein